MGESKKASDNNQTLRNVRVLIDILSQCTVYIAFAAFIIFGVTHKPAEYMPYALLVAVPVVVTYFIRKYVHPLFLFTIIHVAFVIGAVLLGRTEAEMTAYFVSVLVVCIRSFGIRLANVRKTEYMNTSRFSTDIEDVSEDEKKATLQAGERMSVLYCVVMVIGSITGAAVGSTVLVNMETVLFVVFVLLSFAGNQFKELNEMFISNTGKSEFPAKRITGINMIMIVVVSGLMIIGMLVFYNGKYGNIFSVLGTGIMFFVKYFLKFLLAIMHEKDEEISMPEDPTDAPEEEIGEIPDDLWQENSTMSALFTAFSVVVIVALVGLVIYLIYKYARKFKTAKDDNGDEIEFIGNSRKEERRIKKARKQAEKADIPVNVQYRRAFKKAVLSDRKKEHDNESLVSMQPEDITKSRITSEADTAAKITGGYEKARYSDKNISKEELEFMLDFMKKDNYNKHI